MSARRSVGSPAFLGAVFFLSMMAALWLGMTQRPANPLALLAVLSLGASGLLLSRMARELREFDRTLTQNERYIDATAELSPDIHSLFDLESRRYHYVSPSVEARLGFAPEAITSGGLDFILDRVHPEDRAAMEAQLQQLAQSRPPEPGTAEPIQEEVYRVRNAWDEYRWLRTRRRVFARNAAGTAREILTLSQDVSDTKVMEMALVQAEEFQSLGTLARSVVHDLNNILMGIQGQAELASDGMAVDARATLQGIQQSTLRASQLCRQLLSYAGHGRIQLVRHQLNDSVREALPVVESLLPESTHLVLELEADLPRVHADPAQVKHALLNMVANALDNLGTMDGEIAVRTSLVHLDPNQMETPGGLRGDFLCLEVRDTGQSLSEDTLNTIFTPRYGGRFPDRGLGMLAVQWIAREHKGAVDLESHDGQGTRVRVYLPLAEREPEVDLGDEGTPINAVSGVVLVVDDEPTLRTILRQALEQVGYTVIEAVDGVDGFGAFVRHRSSIGLVLLDLTMPRMNGDQVFEEIHKLAPQVPVVLMSGYSQQEATATLAGKGLAGFLSKPCSVKEVQAAVARALGRS